MRSTDKDLKSKLSSELWTKLDYSLSGILDGKYFNSIAERKLSNGVYSQLISQFLGKLSTQLRVRLKDNLSYQVEKDVNT